MQSNNFQSPPPKAGSLDKPIPMAWVVIAILLYLLFQLSTIALKPTPQTISASAKYDRTLLKK